MKYLITLISLLILSNILIAGSPVIIFSDTANLSVIGNKIQILEDKTNNLSIHDIFTSSDFKQSIEQNPNLGVSNSTFWIKFTLQNRSNYNNLLLELSAPLIDEAVFYTYSPDSTFQAQRIDKSQPFSLRKYKHQNYIFDINVPKNQVRTYFLKVRSGKLIQLPMTIGTPQLTFESIVFKDLLSGLYFGTILIILLYNMFLYFTVRDKNYLYYILYIFFVGLTQACLYEYAYKYLWPNSSWMTIHSIFFIPSLSGIAAVLFANNFLLTKKYTPVFYKFSYLIIAIYSIGIILGFFNVYTLSYNIIDFTGLLLALSLLYIASKIALKGYRPAKFFLLAWSFFLASIIIFVMAGTGVIPNNNFTNHILQIGSVIEVTLLSLALADRINILKKEKEASQLQALEILKENERIVLEQNVLLESKVKERTSELETTNKNLKDTQSQLVNAEKMASLGQLTAGIAHEINNPINFVLSNIKPLRSDVEDVFSLLAKYNNIKDAENITEKLKEINDFKVKNDTDYLLTEINQLLKGIDEGAVRTVEIVKGLKTFSHIDETDLKSTNLIEGLDSTLIILNSSIKNSKIKVIKEYDNAILKIDCLGGQINQVFMNIINNAVQAMAETKDTEKENILTIRTTTINDNVIIGIKDIGPGIPDEIKT
ncbi:MAG: 7TM diverse intracellular signaling domain-containing protein [Bacteroidota bacterium]